MPIDVRELLEAGAHFGHQTHRWNPKMKPYIYGARNGIYILDLDKTTKQWVKAEKAIIATVSRGQKLLFVGTKPQAQDIVAEEAARCQQHFVNRRWLGGMLTNFRTIKIRIDRLEELAKLRASEQIQKFAKKEIGRLEKEYQKLAKSLEGIRTMTSLPGMVVVVDSNTEHIAVSEAKKLGIPLLSITDTNCDPEGIDYMIPANDDAIKSIRLFIHAASEAVLQGMNQYEQKIQEESRRKVESERQKSADKSEAQNKAPDVQNISTSRTGEPHPPLPSIQEVGDVS